MSETRDIDVAIDRLEDALRGAGLPGFAAPEDSSPLDEIGNVVAPYLLPSALHRFWERVDPGSLAVTTFPELLSPATALQLHQASGEIGASVPQTPPPTFFVIGYSSHVHRSIELASGWDEGGTIIRWAWYEDVFRIAYRGLVDLIEVLAELISDDRLERGEGFVLLHEDVEEEKQPARLAAAGPHPLYGDTREIPQDLASWPVHWLEASGIDLRDRAPLGATHTIAELVVAASHGPVTARIRGTVIRLIGIGRDVLVVIDDGTRPLEIWCPAGTSPWGPVHRQRFEFEVTIEGSVPPPLDLDRGHEEIVRHASAGELGAAQAEAEAFFGRLEEHRPAAIATDIRPLD